MYRFEQYWLHTSPMYSHLFIWLIWAFCLVNWFKCAFHMLQQINLINCAIKKYSNSYFNELSKLQTLYIGLPPHYIIFIPIPRIQLIILWPFQTASKF